MVAGPGSTDPYEALARRILDLEAKMDEYGRRAIPDGDVPLYPQFVSTQSGSFWTVFESPAEVDCWEGRIGEVWHPTLYVDGVWGYGDPPGGTATYRLYVDDDLTGSWQVGGPPGVIINQGPFDISPYLRMKNIGVRVSVQCSTGPGTARVFVSILGCLQRRE